MKVILGQHKIPNSIKNTISKQDRRLQHHISFWTIWPLWPQFNKLWNLCLTKVDIVPNSNLKHIKQLIFRPVNAFLPIFWAFVILCGFIGLRLAYQSFYKTAVFRRFLVWLQLRAGDNNRLIGESGEQQVYLYKIQRSYQTSVS